MHIAVAFLIERIVDLRRTILVSANINDTVQHTFFICQVIVNTHRTAVITRIQSWNLTLRTEIDIGLHKNIRSVGHEVVALHRHIDIRVEVVVHDDIVADVQVTSILLVNREIESVPTQFKGTHIHRVIRHTLVTVKVFRHGSGTTVITCIHRHAITLRVEIGIVMEENKLGIRHIVVLRQRSIDVGIRMVIDNDVVTETKGSA